MFRIYSRTSLQMLFLLFDQTSNIFLRPDNHILRGHDLSQIAEIANRYIVI